MNIELEMIDEVSVKANPKSSFAKYHYAGSKY